MQNRNKALLERTIYEFLIKDHISLETSIVNDFLFEILKEQSNVQVTLDPDNYFYSQIGFDFKRNKDEKITFSLPSVSGEDLPKILTFFGVHPAHYKTGKALNLDAGFVFDKLLPQFVAYYERIKSTNAAKISEYQVKSKPILEASAVKTLKERTSEALDTITPKDKYEVSNQTAKIIDALMLLEDRVKSLDARPAVYKTITGPIEGRRDSNATIMDFISLLSVMGHSPLCLQLTQIAEAIQVFSRYNRIESVLANKRFLNELKTLLEKDKIALSQCDITEDTLLHFAGATLGIKGKGNTEIGHDASRLVFNFTDIDATNAAKVLKFLRDQGDETATEGHGYRSYANSIPTLHAECASFAIPQSIEEREILESHSIETDGKFFYETIFPQMKNYFSELAVTDPTLLTKYQAQSKKYFDKLEQKAPSITKGGIFPPPVICGNEPDEDIFANNLDTSMTLS